MPCQTVQVWGQVEADAISLLDETPEYRPEQGSSFLATQGLILGAPEVPVS